MQLICYKFLNGTSNLLKRTVVLFILHFVFIFSIKYFPNSVISSQGSDDLSQNPNPETWVIFGGPDTSKEQSLPAKLESQVQLPAGKTR